MTKRHLASYIVIALVYAIILRQVYERRVVSWLKQKLDSGQRERLRKAIYEQLRQVRGPALYTKGYGAAMRDVLNLLQEARRDK